MDMSKFTESKEELRKIQKRRELRQALQKEYNRVCYSPYRLTNHVEIMDPALSRYTAMRMSIYEHWKPDWKSFWKYAFVTYIPITLFAYYQYKAFQDYDEKCRSGEIPFEKRDIRRF